ncbi:MAG: M61 family metallopeptidase [Flavobacteriales bacterium]
MKKIQNHYSIGYGDAAEQQIHVEIRFENLQQAETYIQLPSWRPGRYELGNFAKNISQFRCEDEVGNPVPFEKLTIDSWLIKTDKISTLTIFYQYYANELNAGSSYLDEEQLYVNPVNCCAYLVGREKEPLTFNIRVPDNYQIATGIEMEISKAKYWLPDFDTLADQPFIASSSLQLVNYGVADYDFYIWFQGKVALDRERLVRDFSRFSESQIELFGSMPVKKFHFLVQACSFPYYHGVEHQHSTVLALGPGHQLFTSFYDELLGVSSHELFHVWNVKFIRPQSMFPYDFTKENYSRLGYIYEGLTTWYGDIMLYRSGVFSREQYLKTINDYLRRHYMNYGRFNYSVADSSFDTWLDGYVPGVPHRKVSIYTEGCLIAFMLDAIIRDQTQHAKSLDDLMRCLYEKAMNGEAYDESFILETLYSICDYDFDSFFKDYVYGTEDFTAQLAHAASVYQFQFLETKPLSDFEHRHGLILNESNGLFTIQQTAPGSPAVKAGLLVGDQIIAVNQFRLNRKWLNNKLDQEQIEVTVFSKDILKTVLLQSIESSYYVTMQLA